MYKAFSCILLSVSFLLLAFITQSANGCSYCVANPEASAELIQEKLDFACGQIPESCEKIRPGEPCYVPNDLKKTASYVFNDWYVGGSECDFEGSEVLTQEDPSHGDCKFTCR